MNRQPIRIGPLLVAAAASLLLAGIAGAGPAAEPPAAATAVAAGPAEAPGPEKPPADKPTAEKPLRFVVIGSSEGHGPNHDAVIAQAVKLKPELVVHAGGLVENPRSPGDWQALEDMLKPLLAVAKFYPCRARFDVSLFQKSYRPDGASWGGTTYYSFDHRGVHFIALNSDVPTAVKDPQTVWLAKDLAEAEGKIMFVYFHRPIYSASGKPTHGRGEIFWTPLFAQHKVRAVFSGDHSIYYRTVSKGVTYIVTGGGGSPVGEIMGRTALMRTDVAGAFHHCIEVVVAGDTVRARVVDSEGKTRDEFFMPPVGSPEPGEEP